MQTWKQKRQIEQITKSSLDALAEGSTDVMSYIPRVKKRKNPSKWLQMFTVSLDRINKLQRKQTQFRFTAAQWLRTGGSSRAPTPPPAFLRLYVWLLFLWLSPICTNPESYSFGPSTLTAFSTFFPRLHHFWKLSSCSDPSLSPEMKQVCNHWKLASKLSGAVNQDPVQCKLRHKHKIPLIHLFKYMYNVQCI